MSLGWRDPILEHFSASSAGVSRVTVVADPDQLLAEARTAQALREAGFDVLAFEDPIAFRFVYERRFRQAWDAGQDTPLVLVLRTADADAARVPWDILQRARREQRVFVFGLPQLFPTLAPAVVGELDRADFDRLHSAALQTPRGQLGENGTRDFVLRHVFDLVPQSIKTTPDLLRALLELHYPGRALPVSVAERLLSLLAASGRFADWPLRELVLSRAAFFAFLDERWPRFVEMQARIKQGRTGVSEPEPLYGAQLTGPSDLPFDHERVRVYIDNLFVEGLLHPTHTVSKEQLAGHWTEVGVVGGEEARVERFVRMLDRVEGAVPGDSDSGAPATPAQWLELAQRFAELIALRWSLPTGVDTTVTTRFETLHARVEAAFLVWLRRAYGSLASMSPRPRPVMVHQIPTVMGLELDRPAPGAATKQAVVVVDGLALDQWVVVRESMPKEWRLDEGAAFAWIPSLTMVSRQSIFAARPPEYFGKYLDITAKEESHWQRFWQGRGLQANQIAYVCARGQEADTALLERVKEKTRDRRVRVLGMVVGKVDEMIHGEVMGTDGMHAGVRHWSERGALTILLDELFDAGFAVTLTADHGNVEATGFGRPDVGVTADAKGERVHVYRDEAIRARVAAAHPGSVEWPPLGLPADYLALIAPARRAFVPEGRETVAHGGVCLEEVVVPYVRIARGT